MKKIVLLLIILLTPVFVFAYPIGDVDGNDKVDSADYILIRKHILKNPELTGDKLARADVDGKNGVTAGDYVTIRKIILGLINPIEPTPTLTPTPTPTPEPEVTVSPTPEVKLNTSTVVLEINGSETLTVTISTSNVDGSAVSWTSSNINVATIDKTGKIKAIAGGSTIITAKSSSGKSASCTVDVIKNHNIENAAVDKYLTTKIQDKVNEKSFKQIQEYLKSFLGNYECKSSGIDGKTKRCDIPNAYVSSISGNIKLYTYNVTKKTKTFVTTTTNDLINLYLIPKTTYYLESASNSQLHEYVSITGKVRMLKINGVTNARDLGGWSADGGKIKYGKIIRSAKTEGASPYTEFKYILGDKVKNVDFRRDDELEDVKPKWVSGINYQRNIPLYTPNDKDSKTRKAIETIMTYITKGYNVFFNCKAGKDRTGTAAYILEGILGVKKSNRVIDYELTNFSSSVAWNRKYSKFMSLCSDIKEFDTDNDAMSFVKWYISFSKTTDDKKKDIKLINDFRKAMIDGTPKKYKLSSGKLILE